MRLSELQPSFVRHELRVDTWTRIVGDPMTWKEGDPVEQVTEPREHTVLDVPFAEAHGISFLCPKCFAQNGGARGTHLIVVRFADREVSAHVGSRGRNGQPTRWAVRGSTIDDLQLSPSILLDSGCAWHGFIGLTVPGEVTSC